MGFFNFDRKIYCFRYTKWNIIGDKWIKVDSSVDK